MPVKKIVSTIEGMTCATCVSRVEKIISRFDGVENVNINLATGRAAFDIKGNAAALLDIENSINGAGYRIIYHNSNRNQEVKGQSFEDEILNNFKIALSFAIPVFLISMIRDFNLFPSIIRISDDYINKILFLLTIPIIFIPGKRYFIIFYRNLLQKTADMNSLVAIGTGSAFIYSTFAVLFPELLFSPNNEVHVYFDTTAVIISLMLFGKYLENKARQKTGIEIKKLFELRPQKARLIINNEVIEKNIDELNEGDIVLVKPGERAPADGIIIEGRAAIDESSFTGESVPAEKSVGDNIYEGTINQFGSIVFKVTALGENTLLGRIINFVDEAQNSKAPIQKFADKIAAVFTPIVLGIAILTFLGWIIFGNGDSFPTALVNFIAVLIIACPCALGLATPTAIIVGVGLGAKKGILIRNGESLELAHKITTAVFDKTGTITIGKPKVVDCIIKDFSEKKAMTIARSIEEKSEHPAAKAIAEFSKENGGEINKIDSFEYLPGGGISAIYNNVLAVIGSKTFLNENGIDVSTFDNEVEKYILDGSTIIFLAYMQIPIAMFVLQDKIKESSRQAVDEFKKMNIETFIISGDNEKAVKRASIETGITNYMADIKPNQKAMEIKKMQKSGKIVAMIGDGVNDAPALSQSDLSVAMGTGSDIAAETANIVLVKGNLKDAVKAIKLSKETFATIKQNLFWAFIYNSLGIPLAAFGYLNPMFAALAMSFSSVSVVANSLRLKNTKI